MRSCQRGSKDPRQMLENSGALAGPTLKDTKHSGWRPEDFSQSLDSL
jgi:hypothetical protein